MAFQSKATPISSEIVGYMGLSDEGNYNPGIGAVFTPVGGGETYKLKDITVSAEDAEDFMVPGIEYLQELDPNGSAVVGRYTYVSEAYLKDEYEDEWEDYKDLIGWWKRGEVGKDGGRADDKEIAVGTAFLGSLNGNNLKFTSSGVVPTTSTAITDGGNYNPYFCNFLPVTVKLGRITVSAEDEEDFMVPGIEYLQVLNPNGSAVTARYTYVSKAYLEDEYEDEASDYYSMIGWWQRGHLGEEGYSADNVKLAPGFSFLGSLNGNGLSFNFPSAMDAVGDGDEDDGE